jgi:hypothetical protein
MAHQTARLLTKVCTIAPAAGLPFVPAAGQRATLWLAIRSPPPLRLHSPPVIVRRRGVSLLP